MRFITWPLAIVVLVVTAFAALSWGYRKLARIGDRLWHLR